MNPFSILFMVVRTLYPYLREAWFRDGSFRNWVKDNKITIAWVFFKIVLFCVILYLINTLAVVSGRLTEYRNANAGLAKQNTAFRAQLSQSRAELDKAKARIRELELEVGQVQHDNHVYTKWFMTCKVDIPMPAMDPQCGRIANTGNTRQPKRNKPKPKPKPPVIDSAKPEQQPRTTLRERLRRIFQQGDQ